MPLTILLIFRTLQRIFITPDMDQGSETGSYARASATKRKILEMSASRRLERTSDALITPYCRIRGSREFAPPPPPRDVATGRRLFRGISICLSSPDWNRNLEIEFLRFSSFAKGESRVVTRPSSTPLRRYVGTFGALSQDSRVQPSLRGLRLRLCNYHAHSLSFQKERRLSPKRNSQRPLVKNVQRRKR